MIKYGSVELVLIILFRIQRAINVFLKIVMGIHMYISMENVLHVMIIRLWMKKELNVLIQYVMILRDNSLI